MVDFFPSSVCCGRSCTYGVVSRRSLQLPCPAGAACVNGSVSVCSDGTYTLTTGQSVCQNCTPGYHCDTPMGSPIACPGGTYNPVGLAFTVDACQLCSGGFYCGPSAAVAMKPCGNASFFCPNGTAAPIRVGLGNYSVPVGGNASAQVRKGVNGWSGVMMRRMTTTLSRFNNGNSVTWCALGCC